MGRWNIVTQTESTTFSLCSYETPCGGDFIMSPSLFSLFFWYCPQPTHLSNKESDLQLRPSLLSLTSFLILTHLHILSPLDAEWRCLCFFMLKVCLRSSGVTSYSDLSVWDAPEKEVDRQRFKIFSNTSQCSTLLMHLISWIHFLLHLTPFENTL